ncbi:hypothetical protein MRQ36_00775 [Micromonospora sp. R77]|uniref:hypothetical protein n=1 Tax=Micromonospora sp. R77 TaxID=2925836 RepID=UPI001F61E8A6|nr:hypothetical protein [Micromonospora sp. R77]
MGGRRDAARQSLGQQIQAAEQEAAKRRILAMANPDQTPTGEVGPAVPSLRWSLLGVSGRCDGRFAPRVTYEAYLLAVALTLARRHRPLWSWRRWRRVCRCGADLPCRARHRIPINRGHWPDQGEQ